MTDELAWGTERESRPRPRARLVALAAVAALAGGYIATRDAGGDPSATPTPTPAISRAQRPTPLPTPIPVQRPGRPVAPPLAALAGRYAASAPVVLLVTTDHGPMLRHAQGEFGGLLGKRITFDTVNEPVVAEWSAVRSGGVAFVFEEPLDKPAGGPAGKVYVLVGRELRPLASADAIVPGARPGRIATITYAGTVQRIVEVDPAGRRSPAVEIPSRRPVLGLLPDGRALTERGGDGTGVDVFDPVDGEVDATFERALTAVSVGATVVAVDDDRARAGITVAAPGGRRVSWLLPPGVRPTGTAPVVSADGRLVALAVAEIVDDDVVSNRIVVVDAETGRVTDVPGTRMEPGVTLTSAWSADAGSLYVGSSGVPATVAVWRRGDRDLTLLPGGVPFDISGLVCAADC